MSDINLQEVHDNLVAIAFEAGRMMLAANVNSISTDTKLNCQSFPALPCHSMPCHVFTPFASHHVPADALPAATQPSTS